MTTPSPNSNGVSLREILASELCVDAIHDVRAMSCTHDWRQVRRGDVLVALCDAETDGHDYAAEGVQRGAAAVICERQLPVFGVPQFIVGDSRSAYGRLCQALVGNPSQELKIVGITGTSGKSTVSRLLAAILREAGFQSGALDSFGYYDGWEDRPAETRRRGELSLMTPPVIARSLAQMVSGGVSHATLEIASRELSQGYLAGVGLDAVCLTNVGRDHLGWHASVENYRQAKRRIFEHLNDDGIAIFNADCPASMAILCDVSQPALTIGMRNPAEISAEIVEMQVNEQTFVITAGNESVGVRTSLIGDHHVYNCLTAAATCLAYGIDLMTIAKGLESVDQLPGRMELVRCGQEFTTLIDAARSPETLRVAMRAARQVTDGRLIVVFGESASRDDRSQPVLGRVLGAMADAVVATTESTGVCDLDGKIVGGLGDPRKATIIPDRIDAIQWALDEARAGDTVLIAGMGEREYGFSEEVDAPLCDRTVAEAVLYGRSNRTAGREAAA